MAFRCCFIFDPKLVVNDVLVQLCLNESAVLGSFEWATGVNFSTEWSGAVFQDGCVLKDPSKEVERFLELLFHIRAGDRRIR